MAAGKAWSVRSVRSVRSGTASVTWLHCFIVTWLHRYMVTLRVLGGGGLEGAGGGDVHVVEVDFFDETDGQLVVDEEHLVGGVEAGAEVLAHPPEAEVAKDGEGGAW